MSEQRVGPAQFLLSDGTQVAVPSNTPGGSLCAPLAAHPDPTMNDRCVIIGELVESTNEAAWFGILDGQVSETEVLVPNLIGLRDGVGVLSAFNKEFEFKLADRVAYRCLDMPSDAGPSQELTLPDAAAYFAAIDLMSHEIVTIECGYSN